MAEPTPQTLANHIRRDPLFHMFALPVAGITFIVSIVHAVRHPGWEQWWAVVFFAAFIVVVLKSRLYALRVQDRVIRLEERLRLATLLQEPLRSRAADLTEAQLIALRFAADAECASLAERALGEKLSNSDIKKQVRTWRPDYWRV